MILTNKKKVFYTKDVRTIKVPCLPELSVEKIWPEALKVAGFEDHMLLDWLLNEKHRERAFFYGILATLAEHYVEQLVEDCLTQRRQSRVDRVVPQPREVPIDRNWVNELLSLPFMSGKY